LPVAERYGKSGFCGLSAALHVAQSGTSVAVLEARELGWGASGRNGGQVFPGFKDLPSGLWRLYGEELGHRMAMLGLAAGDVVHDIIVRHGIECPFDAPSRRSAMSPSTPCGRVRSISRPTGGSGCTSLFLPDLSPGCSVRRNTSVSDRVCHRLANE
jgi:hypothetical protein